MCALHSRRPWLLGVSMLGILLGGTAHAQAVGGKPTASVVATINVPGSFTVVPSPAVLTQLPQQGNPCNPGACFSATVTVRANQKWQAQVRVNPTAPNSFYANWIVLPANTQVRLSTAWYTIASGNAATPGQSVPLLFNANKVTGNQGVMPTATQLSSYLEYRVVALP